MTSSKNLNMSKIDSKVISKKFGSRFKDTAIARSAVVRTVDLLNGTPLYRQRYPFAKAEFASVRLCISKAVVGRLVRLYKFR